MLLQSKANTEHLRLVEADLVVDQAFYAKAVEIMENLAIFLSSNRGFVTFPRRKTSQNKLL